jgi:hypothetical protein
MSAEAIRLINAAISVTSGNTITSVDDSSPEAIAANLNYENFARKELVASAWKFARKVDDCAALPDTPDSLTYSYAWQLPDDLLKLRTVTINGDPIDFHRENDREIWTAFPDVPQAVYTYRAQESIWTPAFVMAFTARLEPLFLRIDERANEAVARNQDADKLFAQARLTDSQEEATHEHKKFPLLNSRRTGYAPLRR